MFGIALSTQSRASVKSPICSRVHVRVVAAMETHNVACVDLSDYDNRKVDITKQLMHAGQEIGFFYICNHGISQEEIDEAFVANEKLFALPEGVKLKKPTDKSNKSYILGYSKRKFTTGVLREGFLAGYDHPKMAGLWPDEEDCPDYRGIILKFMKRCHEVTERVMSCFAVGLGLPEDHFKDAMDPRHEDCGTASYNNCYPSTEGLNLPEGMLRIGAHTDFEILTLLFQRSGQPGLEVCPGKAVTRETVKSSDKWIPMDPRPGCITCNIGDALQYASDDRLKSTYHRVRVPKANEYQGIRYSMAYFANVRYSTVLQGPMKKYPAITFANILAKKQDSQHNKIPEGEIEKYTPEEYLKFQNAWPTGPEFEDAAAAAS